MARVLIIEDDIHQHPLIEKAFKKTSPEEELIFTTNAEEALNILRDQNIDIVFVDYILKGMNGLDFIKEAVASGYDIPMILMTAKGSEELVIKTIKAGAYDYVIKDVEYFKLLPQICRKAIESYRILKEAKTFHRILLNLSDHLFEITRLLKELNSSLNVESTTNTFLEGAIKISGATGGVLALSEEENLIRVVKRGIEVKEERLYELIKTENNSFVIEKPEEAGLGIQINIEKMLYYPLNVSEKIRGCLLLAFQSKEEPSDEKMIILELFIDAAMASLMNSILFENVLASKKLWQLTVDAIKDIILVVNHEGTVIRCNRTFAELCGFSPEEIVGKKLYNLDIPEPYNLCLNLSMNKEKDILTEEVNLNEKIFLLSIFPVKLDNEDARIFTLKDITEMRRLREQLYYSDKLASIGRLVSGVAHELNNPLTGIIGYTELLKMKVKDEDILHSLDKIYQSAEKCRSIVENLLTYSRQRPPENTLIFINDLIDSTIELRTYWLRQNDVRIIRDYGELPPIKGDPQQLQQVFLNILMNAEYAVKEAGRMEKIIEFKTYYDKEQNKIIVKISDNGTGITPDVLPKIFDPFFTTKPVDKGTGLGLSITYSILKQHGASISVESTPGEGTTFTVELPVT